MRIQQYLRTSAGFVTLLVLAFAVPASAAHLTNIPVPNDAFITFNGADWAWAAPCNPIDPSCGVVDLTFQAGEGWRIPILSEFLLAPLATDFLFAGANVPLAGVDPVSGAFFDEVAFGSLLLNGAGACASPYFSSLHEHCDWSNAPGSGNDGKFVTVPWGEDVGFVSFSETLLVRGTVVPEPNGVLLFSVGMLVVGRALRRRAA